LFKGELKNWTKGSAFRTRALQLPLNNTQEERNADTALQQICNNSYSLLSAGMFARKNKDGSLYILMDHSTMPLHVAHLLLHIVLPMITWITCQLMKNRYLDQKKYAIFVSFGCFTMAKLTGKSLLSMALLDYLNTNANPERESPLVEERFW
jgi:hypothetical protein